MIHKTFPTRRRQPVTLSLQRRVHKLQLNVSNPSVLSRTISRNPLDTALPPPPFVHPSNLSPPTFSSIAETYLPLPLSSVKPALKLFLGSPPLHVPCPAYFFSPPCFLPSLHRSSLPPLPLSSFTSYLSAAREDLFHALPLAQPDAEVSVATERPEAGPKRVAHPAQARQGLRLPPQDDGQSSHFSTPSRHKARHSVSA